MLRRFLATLLGVCLAQAAAAATGPFFFSVGSSGTSPPPVTIVSIAPTSYSFATGASPGTAIGTPTVTLSSGAFTGSLSLDGGDAGCSPFAISGAHLVVNTSSSAGPFTCGIIATQAGLANSPFEQPVTITGSTLSITGISPSTYSFTIGSTSGTVIGTPAVSMSMGSFTGTLSLDSGDADCANFAISGANLTVTNSSSGGPFTCGIIATESAASNSPFEQAATITGSAAPANSVTVSNVSGSTVSNYPVQIGRPFLDGVIPVGATQTTITGTIAVSNSVATLTVTSGSGLAVGDILTWSGQTGPAPIVASGSGSSWVLSNALNTLASPTSITASAQQCPQTLINGTPATSQADVKNYYPDGSVEFAIIAVVIPSLPTTGSTTLTFQPAACNNTALTSAAMLSSTYNWDAQMGLQGLAYVVGGNPTTLSRRGRL